MPSLSLCMIVRDEAATLARAIASFAGVADEVVVVDTGSKDDTVAVAEASGARVVRHEWRDDFSAARNDGFEACRGDWVFALDADEFLLPESRDEVRRLVDHGTANGYVVTRRDLTPGGATEMRFLRLGRRDTGRRLVGRIHEHFDPPWTRLEPSGVVVVHEGYLDGRNATRQRRNARLLELELKDRPGQPYYLADLAHVRWLLGDEGWAPALARTFETIDLGAPRSSVPIVLALLEIVLTNPDGATAVDHATAEALAERWYPRSVQLSVARCRLAFGRGDLQGAAELGERAVALWESGEYDRTISFDPSVVGPEMRLNLGVALASVGRLEESLRRFEEAAADPRLAPTATANASAVRNARGTPAG